MKYTLFSSFLVGARKEAKELTPKFNARDESRSLVPVDFCTEKAIIFSCYVFECRNQKSLHSSLSPSLTPPKFRPPHAIFKNLGLTPAQCWKLLCSDV